MIRLATVALRAGAETCTCFQVTAVHDRLERALLLTASLVQQAPQQPQHQTDPQLGDGLAMPPPLGRVSDSSQGAGSHHDPGSPLCGVVTSEGSSELV